MKKEKTPIIMGINDYNTIIHHLTYYVGQNTFSGKDAIELGKELKKAKVVDTEYLPPDVVRLNSKVTIRDEKEGRLLELMVVTPDKADIKQRKISVLSPIGTALIGFCKGHKLNWKVPSGTKSFTILEVIPPAL
ncbi:MAG: GreA/GreB family elongation factor [Chitinophagaceae bacterium]